MANVRLKSQIAIACKPLARHEPSIQQVNGKRPLYKRVKFNIICLNSLRIPKQKHCYSVYTNLPGNAFACIRRGFFERSNLSLKIFPLLSSFGGCNHNPWVPKARRKKSFNRRLVTVIIKKEKNRNADILALARKNKEHHKLRKSNPYDWNKTSNRNWASA